VAPGGVVGGAAVWPRAVPQSTAQAVASRDMVDVVMIAPLEKSLGGTA
jgi:hypothetical protein